MRLAQVLLQVKRKTLLQILRLLIEAVAAVAAVAVLIIHQLLVAVEVLV